MSPRVLRRKLQKKLKHKPYRRCPGCGGRMYCRLTALPQVAYGVPKPGTVQLFKECLPCGRREELFWTG